MRHNIEIENVYGEPTADRDGAAEREVSNVYHYSPMTRRRVYGRVHTYRGRPTVPYWKKKNVIQLLGLSSKSSGLKALSYLYKT